LEVYDVAGKTVNGSFVFSVTTVSVVIAAGCVVMTSDIVLCIIV
tara:strand:+ start:343 stop:474 length:132 start_codon:yes stop_codon:yes gene_type:complete